MTIKESLALASDNLKSSQIPSPRLDAEVLLSSLFEKKREYLFTHPEKELTPKQTEKYQDLINRRLRLEPVAYLTNAQEFYGLNFYVDHHVLIPRPETELIISEILRKKQIKKESTIIDLGTGSGCLAITLARLLPRVKIYATDISKPALKIAKKNARKHKVLDRIQFLQGNLLAPIPPEFWSLRAQKIIIANLPYLNQKILGSSPSIQYEPKTALSGGKDGLKIYRDFIEELKLKTKNCRAEFTIMLEINPEQSKGIKKIIWKKFSKKKIEIKKDLSGQNRIVDFKI